MIKTHTMAEASEQLQDNLITLLDGQNQKLVDSVCQTVVDKFTPLKIKAAANEKALHDVASALSRAIEQLDGLLGSDKDESADYQQLLKDEKRLLKFIKG